MEKNTLLGTFFQILILYLSYNEDGIYVCQPSLSQML